MRSMGTRIIITLSYPPIVGGFLEIQLSRICFLAQKVRILNNFL